MPGLPQRIDPFSNATTSLCSFSSAHGSGFWSKHRDEISNSQLQKFWSELTPQDRQELLRIDKHTFFEQARKNMYCSRCNGLLLEAYSQIVVYRKSSQQEGNRLGALKRDDDGNLSMMTGCQEETQDPSVHPWSGLTAARDGTLTLLDGFLNSMSLKELQNVFNNAHARERERELLYPDACGGGGRGWISQGMASYGRGHGPRETCALHTARLSSDTLVDFWSALGEETRQSLLRMKEEDFIERLMYRFDSKRFCRDCRRNVIREFKELKEFKRMRKEPRCTSWFCVADTAFQYEVSDDTILADWHQTFTDSIGSYEHFEWAVGTGEGKSDILEFENVGMNASVEVNDLDLGGLSSCFITLRACRTDGRITELFVKAHALKGQQCVHGRLIVGDGYVTITRGESIRRFFEHAEEAEEEEDDDSVDKDGNELDGECSRPQKHAKSPELAREFLLDAATVIFKEQVEKAFREGTARQNAHSIFVCLALKLLEERVHVACKEIITLEKQMKLLEEEEKEKREEEERRERRRAKEREKKIRRKERLKEKERGREKKSCDSDQIPTVSDIFKEDKPNNAISCRDSVSELGDVELPGPPSPDTPHELFTNENTQKIQNYSNDSHDGDFLNDKEESGCAIKFTRRKLRTRKEFQPTEASIKWPERRRFSLVSENGAKSETRFQGDTFENIPAGINAAILKPRRNFSYAPKFIEKPPCFHTCSCSNHHGEYRAKPELNPNPNPNPNGSATRLVREMKSVSKSESSLYRGNKYSKTIIGNTKQVWEPMEPQKKYPRSNSDSDVTLSSGVEADNRRKLSDEGNENEHLVEINTINENPNESSESPSNETSDPNTSTPSSSSSSDNCSSFLSENSNPQNLESTSSSDSESVQNGSSECQEEEHQTISSGFRKDYSGNNFSENQTTNSNQNLRNGKTIPENNSQHLNIPPQPPMHPQNIHFPVFQPPTMGFYRQTPVSWPAPSFSYPNHYLYGGSLGYNLNANPRFCMQYGSLQPIATTPVLGPVQVPLYQPISKPNPREESKVHEAQKERSIETNTNPNSNTHTNSNSTFSLFHFGGPVALSNGPKTNVVQDNLSSQHGDGDTMTCNKKETTIEEYNLFAANGIKFPILELFSI